MSHEASGRGAMGAGVDAKNRVLASGKMVTQFSTFFVAGNMCGIDVTRVQEVVRPMPMTSVPLAPPYITGLINLRGQVATAIGLRELFELPPQPSERLMNVVCKSEGALLSFLVDEIGDVLEVSRDDFERTPATITGPIRKFMAGVFKINGKLLTVIDVDLIASFLGLSGKEAKSA